MEMYMQSIQKATGSPDMDHAIKEGNEGTDQVLAYIYRYKEEFSFCSAIRRGQNMKITLISSRQSRSSITTYLRSSMQMRMRPRMNFFIHVFCRTGWQYIYEVLTHDKPYDEAAAFMKNVQIFNFAGWKSVFGLE